MDSPVGQELLNGQSNVLRDDTEQDGRDVPAGMKSDRCGAPIHVPVLRVGTSLADQDESKRFENGGHFSWL